MSFVELLEKALHDPAFATRVVSTPHEALKEVGIHPTKEKVEELQKAVHAIQVASRAFGEVRVDNM